MRKIIAFIMISAILFSTMEVTLKIAGLGLDAFQLTFIRFFIGGSFLLPFAIADIKMRGTRIDRSDVVYMALLGFICICVGMVFFQLGVMGANASTAAVIFCTNPIFTMIFAHYIAGESMTRRKALAAAVCIAGLVAIINPLHMSPGNTLPGMLFSLAAAIAFGLYSALGKRRIRALGGLAQTSISFLIGSGLLFFILLALGKPVVQGVGADNLAVVLYVSIAVTGLGYLYYFKAMERSNAAVASLVFFVKPGIAPIFAVIILGEVITLNVMAGILLIFIGTFMTLNRDALVHSMHKG